MNEPLFNQALIKVVGVGGGGNNMGRESRKDTKRK